MSDAVSHWMALHDQEAERADKAEAEVKHLIEIIRDAYNDDPHWAAAAWEVLSSRKETSAGDLK